jgi:hypothetical protein
MGPAVTFRIPPANGTGQFQLYRRCPKLQAGGFATFAVGWTVAIAEVAYDTRRGTNRTGCPSDLMSACLRPATHSPGRNPTAVRIRRTKSGANSCCDEEGESFLKPASDGIDYQVRSCSNRSGCSSPMGGKCSATADPARGRGTQGLRPGRTRASARHPLSW